MNTKFISLERLKEFWEKINEEFNDIGEAMNALDSAIDGKLNTNSIIDNLTSNVADQPLSANQGKILQDQINEMSGKVGDLLYEEISITSFKNNINTAELGSKVTSVKLTWATNKEPTTLTLDGESIDPSLDAYTYTNLNLTSNSVTTKKFTLSATDEREHTVSKETSISFVNGVYYGTIDESATIASRDTILAMTKKLQNSRGMTVTITPNSTEYIAFALPSRLGTPTFKMGGFETTCNCTPFKFENESGFEEDYNIYTTTQTGLGKTEVVVS